MPAEPELIVVLNRVLDQLDTVYADISARLAVLESKIRTADLLLERATLTEALAIDLRARVVQIEHQLNTRR